MGRLVIIGGVAAGLSAASRARRVAPDEQIVVLERGPAAAYGACGLPYFLAGRVPSLERLVAHPPEFFREKRRIDLRLNHEVVEISPGLRRIRVRNEKGTTEALAYDHLVIATGASAGQRWPAVRNIFGAHTWNNVRELEEALKREQFQKGLVIGGGYIGLEIAEALASRGIKIILADAHPLPLRGFEPEISGALPEALAAAKIDWRAGTRIEGLDGAAGGRVLGAQTPAGVIECDFVVHCGGMKPNTALVAAAGVALGRFGGITVDDRQLTSVAGIYAAGDCAETRQLVTGSPTWIPLGAAANKQGRVAGQNAAGAAPARFPGVLGTLAVPLFGREYGRTGLSLEQARTAGYDAAMEKVSIGSAAGYLDGKPIEFAIIYNRTNRRLLGCCLSGPIGSVAGRLDTAAVCLTAAMKLDEIENLDLAYSPAMAPLYEPLLIAAHNALAQR